MTGEWVSCKRWQNGQKSFPCPKKDTKRQRAINTRIEEIVANGALLGCMCVCVCVCS